MTRPMPASRTSATRRLRVRRARADGALGLGLLALAGLGGCARGGGASEAVLRELERLAFVPSGQVHLGTFLPVVLYECPEPLLVDMYEVTRAEWRRFVDEVPAEVAPQMSARARSWSDETGSWPASGMTLHEARAFARWRGMRLPADAEWLFCALGRERRFFPWGVYERQDSVANTLELQLGRPCAVGTFEGGRTPRRLYDMLGNVAEWVEGNVFERGLGGPPRSPAVRDDERSVSALGGSFRTWSRPIFRPLRPGEDPERAWLARALHPRSRMDDVGLRCVAPAAEYLWRRAAEVRDDSRTRARLSELGRRWGRGAAPLLGELARRPGAPPALAALAQGAGR